MNSQQLENRQLLGSRRLLSKNVRSLALQNFPSSKANQKTHKRTKRKERREFYMTFYRRCLRQENCEKVRKLRNLDSVKL